MTLLNYFSCFISLLVYWCSCSPVFCDAARNYINYYIRLGSLQTGQNALSILEPSIDSWMRQIGLKQIKAYLHSIIQIKMLALHLTE